MLLVVHMTEVLPDQIVIICILQKYEQNDVRRNWVKKLNKPSQKVNAKWKTGKWMKQKWS